MTPRQRWLALLDHKVPDRIPTDYQATEEVTARLLRDLGCADKEALYRKLHIDARRYDRAAVEPAAGASARGRHVGHPLSPMSYGTGVYLEPDGPSVGRRRSVADVHAHRWPSCEEFDYAAITQAVEHDDGFRPIHAGCYEPFLLYGYLRGLQTSMEDLALAAGNCRCDPRATSSTSTIEHHRRIFEAGGGRIDLTYVAEDLGSQTGPLMSLAMYRRFLLPNQIKMADLARSFGVHVMYHTDGAARAFLARPDRSRGHRGAQSDPVAMPGHGTRTARRRLRPSRSSFTARSTTSRPCPSGAWRTWSARSARAWTSIAGARWICGPCHNLQPVTPTENIVAMYETVQAIGGSRR